MGEDFIRKAKDKYRRSRQERLGSAFSMDNLFDSSAPPTTIYPCAANEAFPMPALGTTLGLYLDDCGVHVLEGHRVIGVVQHEATEDLCADIRVRQGLHGYVEAKVVKSYPKARRFDVLPLFKTGAGDL